MPAPNSYNRIDLRVASNVFTEGRTGSAISPGMAVEKQSDGEWDPKAGAVTSKGLTLALGDPYQGKTIFEPYAAGDVVFLLEAREGDRVQVLVKDGETIVAQDYLVPDTAVAGVWIKKPATTPEGVEPLVRAEAAISPSSENDFVVATVISV